MKLTYSPRKPELLRDTEEKELVELMSLVARTNEKSNIALEYSLQHEMSDPLTHINRIMDILNDTEEQTDYYLNEQSPHRQSVTRPSEFNLQMHDCAESQRKQANLHCSPNASLKKSNPHTAKKRTIKIIDDIIHEIDQTHKKNAWTRAEKDEANDTFEFTNDDITRWFDKFKGANPLFQEHQLSLRDISVLDETENLLVAYTSTIGDKPGKEEQSFHLAPDLTSRENTHRQKLETSHEKRAPREQGSQSAMKLSGILDLSKSLLKDRNIVGNDKRIIISFIQMIENKLQSTEPTEPTDFNHLYDSRSPQRPSNSRDRGALSYHPTLGESDFCREQANSQTQPMTFNPYNSKGSHNPPDWSRQPRQSRGMLQPRTAADEELLIEDAGANLTAGTSFVNDGVYGGQEEEFYVAVDPNDNIDEKFHYYNRSARLSSGTPSNLLKTPTGPAGSHLQPNPDTDNFVLSDRTADNNRSANQQRRSQLLTATLSKKLDSIIETSYDEASINENKENTGPINRFSSGGSHCKTEKGKSKGRSTEEGWGLHYMYTCEKSEAKSQLLADGLDERPSYCEWGKKSNLKSPRYQEE
jgi:hypothetical protein